MAKINVGSSTSHTKKPPTPVSTSLRQLIEKLEKKNERRRKLNEYRQRCREAKPAKEPVEEYCPTPDEIKQACKQIQATWPNGIQPELCLHMDGLGLRNPRKARMLAKADDEGGGIREFKKFRYARSGRFVFYT